MKIAIVFPSGHLTTTPCITSLALLLARNGVAVDIFTAENITTNAEGSFSHLRESNIQLYVYPIKMKGFWENIPFLLMGFVPWLFVKKLKRKYDFIIAAGLRALFVVGFQSIITRQKFIFLSLELYIGKEMSPVKRRFIKSMESFFNREAVYSIIQDESRSRILQKENKLKGESILIFPNAPLPLSIRVESNRDILLRYGIKDKKIALYSGSVFAPWAMASELIKQARYLPSGWILLVHSRAKLDGLATYQKYDFANEYRERIIFTSEPLNDSDYEELVRSIDVGIALYDGRRNGNIQYVGYSSGKIAQYLKLGIPVLVNKLPLLDELIQRYGCGYCLNQLEEIPAALNLIETHYEKFSLNAERAFREVLNPELYFLPLLQKLLDNVKYFSHN